MSSSDRAFFTRESRLNPVLCLGARYDATTSQPNGWAKWGPYFKSRVIGLWPMMILAAVLWLPFYCHVRTVPGAFYKAGGDTKHYYTEVRIAGVQRGLFVGSFVVIIGERTTRTKVTIARGYFSRGDRRSSFGRVFPQLLKVFGHMLHRFTRVGSPTRWTSLCSSQARSPYGLSSSGGRSEASTTRGWWAIGFVKGIGFVDSA
jgi:hypothetical protein